MRIPVRLAWVLLVSTFFTAGLLRRFHESTPLSPYAPAAVGSLLFALIVFLGLVALRERDAGAVPGPGIRLGSLTPVLLMLLVEKWVSITLYQPAAWLVVPAEADEPTADALFRALAGFGLLVTCGLVATFSRPSRRRTWATCRPARLAKGLVAAAVVVALAYAVLALIGLSMRAPLALRWGTTPGPWGWIVGGQALRALAEEAYYRGLLLWEMDRIAPRLGARGPAARRWFALLFVGALFGMEHVTLYPTPAISAREAAFASALAVLLGLLVYAGRDLGLVTGVHAWINWLILGAAPRFETMTGEPALPPGSYISVALLLAFGAAWVVGRRRRSGG